MTMPTLHAATELVRATTQQRTRIDMTNARYGELTGIRFSHLDTKKNAHWLFSCSCGEEQRANTTRSKKNKRIAQ